MYFHVWWSSRFWIFSPIASFYCLECTKSATVCLYVFSSYTLLLILIVDITFLDIVVVSAIMVEVLTTTPPPQQVVSLLTLPNLLMSRQGVLEVCMIVHVVAVFWLALSTWALLLLPVCWNLAGIQWGAWFPAQICQCRRC